jgi:glycosyltransferase involved in cell wall biosynthesis
MKKLSICIPNYNRIEKLKRLIVNCSEQILKNDMTEKVEICINDDCSTEQPDDMVDSVRNSYPEVEIKFFKNDMNMGMDYNFLQSVRISEGEFCWIIGNDDLPTENGIGLVMRKLEKYNNMDIFVGPFDSFGPDGDLRGTSIPIIVDTNEDIRFDTGVAAEVDAFIDSVNDCNAIFGFLSNVVFKKSRWIEHGDMFESKMNTIFIQMYMNLQTLKEGAKYIYTHDKFINNYADDEVNATFKREYDVFVGLIGVIDYFFEGSNRTKLQKCIVDPRINGRMWEVPDDSPLKKPLLELDSYKNELYRRYFIRPELRGDFFNNRRVLVYGAGKMGKKAVKDLEQYNVDIVAIIDADLKKIGTDLEGHIVNPVQFMEKFYCENDCTIVVANNNSLCDIIDMLLDKNIDEIAIIT